MIRWIEVLLNWCCRGGREREYLLSISSYIVLLVESYGFCSFVWDGLDVTWYKMTWSLPLALRSWYGLSETEDLYSPGEVHPADVEPFFGYLV